MKIQCFDETWKEVGLTEEEKQYYIEKAKDLYNQDLENIIIKYIENNKAEIYNIPNCEYDNLFYTEEFERIRRITGYLTGATTTWNNAKQSELRDRVKHC